MSEKKGFASWFLGKKGSEEEPGVERLGSPLAGTVIGIEQVSDKTFADKILGDGIAVIPSEGKVFAPADGTVESLMESHHAVCLLTLGGAELLVHVGRDTVSLNGRHFAAHVKEGDKVKRGQLLLSFEREQGRFSSNASAFWMERKGVFLRTKTKGNITRKWA